MLGSGLGLVGVGRGKGRIRGKSMVRARYRGSKIPTTSDATLNFGTFESSHLSELVGTFASFEFLTCRNF
jgi:hypothetical protein